MKYLGLGNNIFQGTLHTEMGLMSDLLDLQLFGNEFEGSIPSELGSVSLLGELGLSNNDLVSCLR